MAGTMLRELSIRNLAVVEEAVVPFAAGLNVLTGETGAGVHRGGAPAHHAPAPSRLDPH
jgi:hypothetical protein